MGFLQVDNHTFRLILIFGNLISTTLFYFYFYKLKRDFFDYCFFSSKVLQIIAWVLIIQRGQIPNLYSLQIGSSLLSLGFMLESVAITSTKFQFSTKIAALYGVSLLLAILNLWIPAGRTYAQTIGLGSMFFAFPYAISGYLLLRGKGHSSTLQKWLGAICSASFLVLAFRGVFYLFLHPIHLFGDYIMQALTSYAFFTIMIAGSVGFILIKKELVDKETERSITELQLALQQVKTLRGLIPICAACHKIRNDQGYWQHLDDYIRSHSEADFTHGICPDCKAALYPDFVRKQNPDPVAGPTQ